MAMASLAAVGAAKMTPARMRQKAEAAAAAGGGAARLKRFCPSSGLCCSHYLLSPTMMQTAAQARRHGTQLPAHWLQLRRQRRWARVRVRPSHGLAAGGHPRCTVEEHQPLQALAQVRWQLRRLEQCRRYHWSELSCEARESWHVRAGSSTAPGPSHISLQLQQPRQAARRRLGGAMSAEAQAAAGRCRRKPRRGSRSDPNQAEAQAQALLQRVPAQALGTDMSVSTLLPATVKMTADMAKGGLLQRRMRARATDSMTVQLAVPAWEWAVYECSGGPASLSCSQRLCRRI